MLDDTSMATLLETFLSESEEGLETAEAALLLLDRDPDDADAVALAFRAVHTIKGNAGVFEFHALGAVAHAMEDLLDGVRSGRTLPTPESVSTLLEGVDILRGLLFEKDRTRTPGARERALIAQLQQGSRSGPMEGPAARRRSAGTIRVDVARVDRLLDLSGEIGIARGRVDQMLEDESIPRKVVLEAQRDAELLHREMQELAMKLRMVPVGPGFRSLQRVARDAAQVTGKDVQLIVEGGEVEVDLAIVEHLRESLTHMIRNSVGHGIEEAAIRRAAGKPVGGRLTLRSFQDAGSIVVELVDDGRGIDLERVASRAVERGLVPSGKNLTPAETLDLIFHPGFSTADAVTGLSGRGVGLDVVRRNIDNLHGSVSVESRKGEGTAIRLRVPLTLAVVQGLRVGLAGESFIVPMECVVEALRFLPDGDPAACTGVLTHRTATIPWLRLRERLSPVRGCVAKENVVIVRWAHGEAGLVVDELHGECQSVVKPFAGSLRGIPGLTGSAILPSGGIAFVVDVPALLQTELDRTRASSLTSSISSHQESSCSTS